MSVFLHAACGSAGKNETTVLLAQEEWEEVRMDENPAVNPDITASLLTMDALESGTFDVVFTSRSLERLYAHEVPIALENIGRVLKDDGYFVVFCADLQSACALIAEDKLLEPAYESSAGAVAAIDIIYGFRPAIAAGHKGYASHCGFTAKALGGTLSNAGFESIWLARNPKLFTIAAVASKKKREDAELREIAMLHFS